MHIYEQREVIMGQVTVYLDDATEEKARAAARAEGVPLSKWVAARIQRDRKRSCRERV